MIRLKQPIRIGSLRFNVILANKEEKPDLAKVDGYTDFDRGEIVIANCLPMSRKQKVLVHEIIHACVDDSGLGTLFTTVAKSGFKGDLEEQVIQSLSSPLTLAIEQLQTLQWERSTQRRRKPR